MRIVINATGAVAGGSITYLLNLLPALADLHREHRYIVLLSRHQHKVQLELPDSFCIRKVDFPTPSVLWRLLWEQTVLPLWLARAKAEALYAPMDRAPLLAPCPTVLTVRNSSPYYRPSTSHRRLKYALQKWMTRFSARKARKVIFVSYHARDTIAPQLGIPFEKTEVVYHGLDHNVFDPTGNFSIPLHFQTEIEELQPFVLCVSTINPHKNYETLFQGWAQVRGDLRKRYKLVVAGICVIPEYFDGLVMLTEKLGIDNEVVFLGEVPYQRIPYLYKCASAFVFPSSLETFGHPLVEAMAMKLPIVAATSACIPEIVNGAALLFETKNPEQLGRSLERVLTDQDLRSELISKGENRSAEFSWLQTAKRTLAILESVAGKE